MTEPVNPFADDDRARPVDPKPAQRPDWLVGADEGASSERNRREAPGTPLPFKLTSAADRASDPEAAGADEPARPKAPVRPVAPQAPPPAPKPVAWPAASSSTPTLKAQPGQAPAPETRRPRGGPPPLHPDSARA